MSDEQIFQASPEAKSKAKTNRIIAAILWIVAIGLEIYAIFNFLSDDKLYWLIGAAVIMLILAMTGSYLWKKSNRLDPASEKEPTRFFIQNQLGAIMAALAFLPLLVLILTNKDMSGKTKGIAGAVVGLALASGVLQGIEWNPASIEQYTEEIQAQTAAAQSMNIDTDNVYWSKAGNKYHAFDDCYHIKGKALSTGSIKDSFEQKGLSELCKTCQKKAEKSSSILEPVLEGSN